MREKVADYRCPNCQSLKRDIPADELYLFGCQCGVRLLVAFGDLYLYVDGRPVGNRIDAVYDQIQDCIAQIPTPEKRFDEYITEDDVRFLHEFAHVSTR